jgi:anti-sigma factor RsiW
VTEASLTTSDEMSCRELVELVTGYLEGVLAPPERARFEQHLEACPYCVVYVSQMREVIGTLGKLSEEAISAPAREALLGAFRDWKRATPR